MDDGTRTNLRTAYDSRANERDGLTYQDWKAAERQAFLELLRQENRQSLLEIGAGPGRDSLFFQEQGLTVTAVDLSPEMVTLCRTKGLDARVMDVTALDFPAGSFDAAYTMNTLLHVPKAEWPATLDSIAAVLVPDGLLYLGVYGGIDSEGIWEDDAYEPKRFFVFHTDEQIREAVVGVFELVSFRPIELGEEDKLHFQSLVLRKRP
ncbi:MAG: methyltransferase domain-containing protein [Chloroflexota bacterium]